MFSNLELKFKKKSREEGTFPVQLLPAQPLHSQSAKPFYCGNSNRILFINQKNSYHDDVSENHNIWIYEYNLLTDTYSDILKYPSFLPESGCQTLINEQTNEIIMFTSSGWVPIFCIINLKNNIVKSKIEGTMIEKKILNLPSPTCHPICIFNEIHLIESFTNVKNSKRFNHFKYDANTKTFISCSTFVSEKNLYTVSNVIFIESLNLLMAVGGQVIELDAEYSDNIYGCKINSNKQKVYEWKLMNIKLPVEDIEGKVTNIFDTIIIFIAGNTAWFFDLRNQNNGWFESKKRFPIPIPIGTSVININNDFIHFYCGYRNLHFKLSVVDMMPQSMHKKYGIMYGNMVNGYIKKIQKDTSSKIDFPIVLTKLIVMYFSNFKY